MSRLARVLAALLKVNHYSIVALSDLLLADILNFRLMKEKEVSCIVKAINFGSLKQFIATYNM